MQDVGVCTKLGVELKTGRWSLRGALVGGSESLERRLVGSIGRSGVGIAAKAAWNGLKGSEYSETRSLSWGFRVENN